MLTIQRPTVEPLAPAENSTQQFIISPLEPGFGHTLGSSLRRVLLSSIPGAAITQVRFDDVLHEFTTIPGVVEDVTDVILNLKDIVVRVDTDEPVVMRLEAQGPGEVVAELFQVPADVEIINPDLHIAELADGSRIALEVTVEKGRGYVPADRIVRSKVIGVIPVDAIFSPVRRVAFSVEPTRVGTATNYDALTLTIETDGSIEPGEALASAGETLGNLMELVANLSEEPQGLILTEALSTVSGSPDLELSVEDLGLSERPRNCLRRAQIATIAELISRSESELLGLANFGQKSLDEVIQKLDERGLSLRGSDF